MTVVLGLKDPLSPILVHAENGTDTVWVIIPLQALQICINSRYPRSWHDVFEDD